MKKKLFVLLASLMLGLVFQSGVAAYAKSYIYIKKKPVRKQKVYLGSKGVKLKYNIEGRKKGIRGEWKSSDKDVVKVDKKGKCKITGEGKATVSYVYKWGRKNKTIKVKFNVLVKTGNVVLTNADLEKTDVTVGQSYQHNFNAELTADAKALKVDEDAEPTWGVYYKVFKDAGCNEEVDGFIDEDGTFTGKETGTYYVRAESKEKPTSKSKVVSNVITVTVGKSEEQKKQEEEAKKKEEERKKEEEKKKKEEEQKKLAAQYKIEISGTAPLKSDTAQNGVYYATAHFKILDGTGKDVTNSGKFNLNDIKATFAPVYPPVNGQIMQPQPQVAQVTGNGTITLTLISNMGGNISPYGISGKLNITLNYLGQVITNEANVAVAPPVNIARAEFFGIYKCVNGVSYEKVLDSTYSKIAENDIISTAGTSPYMNNFQGSYYMLFKATDSYGNTVTNMGVEASKLGLTVSSGTTGIELAQVKDQTNRDFTMSVKPIVINGVEYLTFPLKMATVKKGELTINTINAQPVKLKIGDGSTLRAFYVTAPSNGTAYIGEDTILNYSLINSKGATVTDYNDFVSLLGLTDQFNQGFIQVMPGDKAALSSKTGSMFTIRNINGKAEIHYTPQVVFTTIGNTMSDIAQDEITTLKGYGLGYEQRAYINVTRRK